MKYKVVESMRFVSVTKLLQNISKLHLHGSKLVHKFLRREVLFTANI